VPTALAPTDRGAGPEGIALGLEDRRLLERWVRSPTAAQRVVLRSRVVLHLASGKTQRQVARVLGISRTTVDLWRRRFLDGGCQALCRDKAGRGRKRKVAPDTA
jgi:hypothetical protein